MLPKATAGNGDCSRSGGMGASASGDVRNLESRAYEPNFMQVAMSIAISLAEERNNNTSKWRQS